MKVDKGKKVYIIRAENIPDEFKGYFKQITVDNMFDTLYDIYNDFIPYTSNELFKIGQVTLLNPVQFRVMRIIPCYDAMQKVYIMSKAYINCGDNLYIGIVDSKIDYQTDNRFHEFIETVEIIDEEEY